MLGRRWFTYLMQLACVLAMVLHAYMIHVGILIEQYPMAALNLGLGFIPCSIFMMQFRLRKIIAKIEELERERERRGWPKRP